MKQLSLLLFNLILGTFLWAQATTDHIHIDQFGYLPNAKKVAVISNPQTGYNSSQSYTPGATLEVVNASTSMVALSGAPSVWNNGNTHAQSGDKGWWFDFSSITTPGDYYIRDAANNTRSYTFKINESVYNEILKVAGRMFYYNRCNAPKSSPYADANWTDGNNFNNNLQDGNCRFYLEPNNPATEKDLSGGWFDAGDYNKYVTFASSVVHDLLSAYEENGDAFGDDWNIPESGNGIPDVLDELKWELDWLKKMQNSNGAVHIKMGSISYSDNPNSPPSANVDPRYYGPVCSSSTIAVAAMFAHAALVFANVPGMQSEASTLETLAELSWDNISARLTTSSLDVDCDDGTIKSGLADRTIAEQREEALMAAIYLYALTGDTEYGDWVRDNINDAATVAGGWVNTYRLPTNEALLYYTTLATANTTTKNTILNAMTPHIVGDWDGFFGMNDDDLYRAYMPDNSYHWGSNNIKARYGTMNNMIVKYGINPSQDASYSQKAEELLHYFHGINPQNMVYLSNMYSYGAEKSANEIYHGWFNDGTDYDHALNSLYGPAPGYVVGGANVQYTYSGLTPPYNQPRQKAYLDFNDSNPGVSWEITEPAIYYQSSYIRLLANYANNASAPLPISLSAFTAENKDGDVQLDWKTIAEINSKAFEVERSTNGADWVFVASKDAAGNSTTALTYEHLDIDPWGTATTLYYRLKMVDIDEEFTYSEIKSVDKLTTKVEDARADKIFFHPNPVIKSLTITFPEMEECQMMIYDFNGKMIRSFTASANNLDVSFLNSGMYTLQINRDGESWRGRFVKM